MVSVWLLLFLYSLVVATVSLALTAKDVLLKPAWAGSFTWALLLQLTRLLFIFIYDILTKTSLF